MTPCISLCVPGKERDVIYRWGGWGQTDSQKRKLGFLQATLSSPTDEKLYEAGVWWGSGAQALSEWKGTGPSFLRHGYMGHMDKTPKPKGGVLPPYTDEEIPLSGPQFSHLWKVEMGTDLGRYQRGSVLPSSPPVTFPPVSESTLAKAKSTAHICKTSCTP